MTVMPIRAIVMACVGSMAVMLAVPSPAEAQRAAAGPPDWPCVQRLIPDLHWASIWSGPSIEQYEESWWADQERGRTARFASARTTSERDAVERIRSFAEDLGEDRERQLTLLFAGVFELISRERTRTIEAILRYSRGQVGRLERLSSLVDALEELRASEDANAQRIEELEHELHWERRVFEDRQASLRTLCDQPYALEERLSRLVRAIQADM